jgi:hypothetical protein
LVQRGKQIYVGILMSQPLRSRSTSSSSARGLYTQIRLRNSCRKRPEPNFLSIYHQGYFTYQYARLLPGGSVLRISSPSLFCPLYLHSDKIEMISVGNASSNSTWPMKSFHNFIVATLGPVEIDATSITALPIITRAAHQLES